MKLHQGTGSDSESDSSESDEEELVDSKGFKLEVRKRQYEVEFTEKKIGLALEPAGHKKNSLGAKIKRVQPDSAADTSGKVKAGHFIMAIGTKDMSKSTVEAVNSIDSGQATYDDNV